jgi:hypothetical protein
MAPTTPALTSYERERKRTIAANQRVLEALGLQKRPFNLAGNQTPLKRQRVAVAAEPTRRSSRQTSSKSAGPYAPKAPAPQIAWHQQIFDAAEKSFPAVPSHSVWDARRLHQHLERSPSGRSVATTGVAGYGAALCAQRASTDACSWEVRAIRFGVGGFGVGIVRAGMRPPYKSLGKTSDVVGVYLSGGSFSVGGEERAFGPSYQQGDRIGVTLRRSYSGKADLRDLVFSINSVEVGVAASGLRMSEGLHLAVQPYMGGVALLA